MADSTSTSLKQNQASHNYSTSSGSSLTNGSNNSMGDYSRVNPVQLAQPLPVRPSSVIANGNGIGGPRFHSTPINSPNRVPMSFAPTNPSVNATPLQQYSGSNHRQVAPPTSAQPTNGINPVSANSSYSPSPVPNVPVASPRGPWPQMQPGNNYHSHNGPPNAHHMQANIAPHLNNSVPPSSHYQPQLVNNNVPIVQAAPGQQAQYQNRAPSLQNGGLPYQQAPPPVQYANQKIVYTQQKMGAAPLPNGYVQNSPGFAQQSAPPSSGQQQQLFSHGVGVRVNQYPQVQQPYEQQQQGQQNYNYQGNTGVGSVTQPMANMSLQQGFNKSWGIESVDLMQVRNILPTTPVEQPVVTLTQFDPQNHQNCASDLFSCTLTKIPESQSLLQKCRLPLGVLVHPFKDLTHLTVIQCQTIVRCRSCRTYINPFVHFVDQQRWKCNLCFRVNDLPEEFFFDPSTKTYGDPARRPEIKSSTIEYIAPSEYMLRPPQPTIYLYLLDVSHSACDTGYLKIFCDTLLDELENLPGDGRTKIGFITFDSRLHFYNFADGFSRPQQMIVSDIEDVFLPCPDNLLTNLNETREMVKDLLQQLPMKFMENHDTDSALGAALQAAHLLLSPTGGRVTVMQVSLPNVGPGALKPREDPNLRAGKDVNNLGPASDFYKKLSLDSCGQQIGLDIFALNSQYVDLATLACAAKYSGGCIHSFSCFHALSDPKLAEKYENDLRRYLTRKIGFEAVMRIRCTKGLTMHTFHGNFFVRSTDLLSLPNVNPDAGFGMQISIEDSLTDTSIACFQAALLYTTSNGERRIRVHTLCLPISNNLIDIVHSADQQTIIGLIAKMAVDRSITTSVTDAREAIVNAAIDAMSTYKSVVAGNSPGLIAPNSLTLLPLYCLALLKHDAFRVGISTRLDDRVFAMCQLKTLPLAQLMLNLYPSLYQVNQIENHPTVVSDDLTVPQLPLLHLSAEKINSSAAYLLDTGDMMYLYIGKYVGNDFCNNVLNSSSFASCPDYLVELPDLDTKQSELFRNFVTHLLLQRPFHAPLQVIREDSKQRHLFTQHLLDDRTESTYSYYEFLEHIKRQISK